jgi:hypothetical protein
MQRVTVAHDVIVACQSSPRAGNSQSTLHETALQADEL